MHRKGNDRAKWRWGEMKSRERKAWGERSIRGCRDEEMHLKSTWFDWSKSFLMFVLSSDCCERNAAAFEVRVGSEHLTDTLSSNNDVKTWIKQKKWKTRKPAVKHERCEEETSVHSTFCRSEAKDGNHNKHVIMKKITTSSAISRL